MLFATASQRGDALDTLTHALCGQCGLQAAGASRRLRAGSSGRQEENAGASMHTQRFMRIALGALILLLALIPRGA